MTVSVMDIESVNALRGFTAAGGTALVASLFAALSDHRHRRRANLDKVSLISWGLLSALFSILSIILLATAAKIYFTLGG